MLSASSGVIVYFSWINSSAIP